MENLLEEIPFKLRFQGYQLARCRGEKSKKTMMGNVNSHMKAIL